MELKLTPERQEIICEAIALGSTYKLAAQAAGITYDCFHIWMTKGENNTREDYVSFFNAVKKAEADHAEECLKVIRQQAKKGNWFAAAWLLERRHADQYGKDSMAIQKADEILKMLKEQADGKEIHSGNAHEEGSAS